jgi:hypothetical protein
MLAIAQRPTTTSFPCQAALTLVGPRLTACALAEAYLEYASALWRGESGCQAFGAWLSRFRCGCLPAEPLRPPDAVSPHGGGGRGIRWHEAGTAILGYVPGTGVGYRVPVGATLPE